jgi:cytochrome c-type biogenesis protein CcmH/NrfG
MENEPTAGPVPGPSLGATPVYAMAGVCLIAGLAIGYLLRGSPAPVFPAQPLAQSTAQPAVAAAAPSVPSSAMAAKMPTLTEMKQMADKQAAPLLERLKSDPNNSSLLAEVGSIYHATHQFKEAANYFGKAVQFDGRNVPLRIKLASSLYRTGDVDGAIAQLDQALKYQPDDANSLFDLGLIRWQGKQDGKGAVAAWRHLLKSNPQLSADRKSTVQKLIADVIRTQNGQQATKGKRSNDR